ncbi:MAG: hypothetical protein IPK17_08755 [Chloroflexi bacterium]|uniref:hypothetical protein n=1 Tax=Candidatus Flexifilum breve TaxID=3140694 RepID=UPI003135E3D0|nr:hypothetical protein [Chloroflexota bacterium]
MQETKVTAADVRQPLTPLKPADIKAPRPNRSAPRRHPPKRMATARAAVLISAHGPAATANSNKPFLN